MSDPITHDQISATFLEVRDLPPDEAARRVQAIEDPALREEVRSLLEFDVRGSTSTPYTSGPALGAQGSELGTPSHIGPYTILERLGHGGSGVVLLAQQEKPVRRRVAIKIVPYAAISPDFAARFEFERRALERTNHPNIARILDAGRTSDGLPYLVMEYVEGESITAFCRKNWLSLPAAIDLILQVADAVQHAHQRGVIHRDLKPANILVTQSAGAAPIAHVLDFGISKPTADAIVTQAPPTSATPIGTPGYMAPEQTGGQAIDTRADVYALGAVLYELTCGRTPIESAGDALETLRRMREQVPFPASRVRKARGDAPTAGQPGRALLTDLDCILGMSLEKDPARRYPTMAAFADDLKRLLRQEPIGARPPALSYRAARFAQRNRALVAAAAVAALALLIGIGGLVGGLIEARRQQKEALNQSQAQAEINRFLNDDLLAQASPQQQGEKVTAIELLDRAARTIEKRFPDRPLTAAAIHHTLGTAYMELAAFDKSKSHFDRALELRRTLAGESAPDTIRTQAALGSLLVRQEKYDEGLPVLTALLPRARTVLGKNDPALYALLNDLGTAEFSLDNGKDAVAHLTESVEGRRRLLGEKDPAVLETMTNLAQALDRTGDTQASLDMDLKALALADSMEEPHTFTLIGLNNNIGATYQDLNQDDKAAPYIRKAAALAADFLGPDNPDTLSIQANLASLEAEHGDPQKGIELYDTIVKARTRILGPDAQATLVGRYGYYNATWIAKHHDDAAAGFAPLLADMARVLGPKHWLTIQTKAHLALALADGGHDTEALPYAKEATAEFTALYGDKHERTVNAAAELTKIEARIAAKNPASQAAGK
jgi:serine/threonine protein kinase